MALSAGRPAGPAEQTLARNRDILARHRVNCTTMASADSVAILANQEALSRSAIWDAIRKSGGEGMLSVVGERPVPIARPRPRMSQRTVLHRAWIAMRLIDVFRLLGDAVALFWINTVLQIHEVGEDGELHFGTPGEVYRSRRELAEAAGRTEADLDDLLHRGLLIPTAGGGIGLPYRFGLRPREPVGGNLAFTPPGRAPDSRQGSLPPMGLPRPGESRNIQADESRNIPPGSGSESSEITPPDSRETPLAPGLSPTTTTKDSDSSLGGGGGESFAAGEREPVGESSSESSKIPPGGGDIPGVETALAAELLALAGRSGPARPPELVLVRAWLETKTANEIREAIGTRMEQKNAVRAPDLSYFDKRVREWAPRLRVADASPPVPTPELPEDPASTVAWLDPRGPDNPRLASAWAEIRATLRDQLGTEYRSWLRDMVLLGLDGDVMAIELPSMFKRDHVRTHYGDRVAALWKLAYPEAHGVDFKVNSSASAGGGD